MKVCPSCKSQCEEKMNYCRKCGIALISDKASSPSVIAKRHVFDIRISQEPGNTDILVEYGDYLSSVELIDDALIQYFKVVEMKPADQSVRMKIAEAYLSNKQFNFAITQILILIESSPKDIFLREKLYSIYVESRKLNEAEELLQQMYDLESSNLNHLVRRLEILRKKPDENHNKIIEVCKNLHSEKPFQHFACGLYIGILMSESANGNADPELWVQAEKLLQKANSQLEKLNAEEQVSCRLYLCWTQLKLNRNAFDFIQNLKEIGQKTLSKTQHTILADCFLMIGNAQFQAELIEEAIESYKSSYSYSETLQIRQCLAKAYLIRGQELYESGKFNEACNEFQNGLSYQPDNAGLQTALEISQAKKKKRQRIRFSAAFAGLVIIISIGLFLYYGQNVLEVECNQAATISLNKGDALIATKEGNLLQTSLLRYGSYSLQIEKEGYAPIKEEVNPGFGRGTKRIKFELKPIYGGLKVSSDPSNAKVIVKNRYTEKSCSTPCEMEQLFAMPSSIELRIPGYVPYKVDKTIPKVECLDLGKVVFKGTLKVDSNPTDADVYINDQLKGKTPFQIADHSAKKTKIEIKKNTMGAYIANIDITPNGLTDLGTVTLSKLGAIRIDSKPQGAKVFLDESQVGTTPFSMSDIDVGSHVMRVQYLSYTPIEKNISLQSGELIDLGTVSFLDLINTLKRIAIGDRALGGVVAYILKPGDPGYDAAVPHGLIAAERDQGRAEWGCRDKEISGARGTAIGTGKQNTIAIVKGCSTAGIAARICYDLFLNGYRDWYLPSKAELNQLYLNRVVVGGFADDAYWSSSELTSYYTNEHSFKYGLQNVVAKNTTLGVHAVRSF